MDEFIPVVKTNQDVIDDMFIKNNNSQIYMSAAAYRFLGNPDGVVFLLSKDEKLVKITTPQRSRSKDAESVVAVRRRPDSEACRLSGVPKSVIRHLHGRMNAIEASNGALTFSVRSNADE